MQVTLMWVTHASSPALMLPATMSGAAELMVHITIMASVCFFKVST